jgi:hypothetical protein
MGEPQTTLGLRFGDNYSRTQRAGSLSDFRGWLGVRNW